MPSWTPVIFVGTMMAMFSEVRVQAAIRASSISPMRRSTFRTLTIHNGLGRRRHVQSTFSAMYQQQNPTRPIFVMGSHRLPYRHTSKLSMVAQEEETTQHLCSLTNAAVRKMRLSQLREELRQRGMNDKGKRDELMRRLLASLKVSDNRAAAGMIHQETQQVAKLDQTVSGSLSTEQKEDCILELVENPSGVEDEIAGVGDPYVNDVEAIESTIDSTNYTNPEIDPDQTYVFRVNSAHSGSTRVVEGSGIGFTLFQVDSSTGQTSAIQTNQVLLPGSRSAFEAVYSALVMAMRHAKNIGIRHLVLVCDVDGIVRQVNGECGIRDVGHHRELYQKVKDLEPSFDSFAIRHSSDTSGIQSPHHGLEAHHGVHNKVLAKSALARQQNLESEWKDMVDPMTDMPAASYKNLNQYNIQPDKEYLLQFDGGARGNPFGTAGAGMAIFDNEDEIWCGWNYLGENKTNNVAEYESLIAGLECAEKLGIRKLRVEGDSELIVKQINGLYQVKKDWLKLLHARAKQLMSKFDKCSIKYIPRADNKRADFLANHAMDTGTCHNSSQI